MRSGRNDSVKYRRDIDGLRAIAILPVVLFHASVPGFTGGFVGVDIFFVISGYLITMIIASEVAQAKFSTVQFYERRIRRIFPALFTVLTAASLCAGVLYLPNDLAKYSQSLIATTLFGSNMLFWRDSGYFDVSAFLKPLLQTWSLAVEEQFYILFPLFVALVHRYAARWLKASVLVAAGLSFAASVWGVHHTPGAAFYFAPLRAWELLMGSLLALGVVGDTRSATLREALAGLGILLIVGSVVTYNESTPFPGLAALPPCLGAAFILYAGRGQPTWVGRLLSTRFMVGIGLVSYSLYLWHWPVFVFAKYVQVGELPPERAAGCLALSGVLAWASWRFVEQPARNVKAVSRRTLFVGAAALMVATIAVGLGLPAAAAAFRPVPSEIQQILGYTDTDPQDTTRGTPCFLRTEDPYAKFQPAQCATVDPTRPNYLLMGDSHANHLATGLRKVLPEVNLLQVTAAGCKPGLAHLTSASSACQQASRFALGEVLPTHKVDVVVLSARWTTQDAAGLRETLTYLHRFAKKVVLVGPIPEYKMALPGLIARGLLKSDPDYAIRYLEPGGATRDAELAVVAAGNGAIYASTYAAVCPGGQCQTLAAPGVPMQYDYGHLTALGSTVVVQRWRDAGLLP